MNRITPFLAGAALLASACAVEAGEPVKLTDAQMDTVRAGLTVILGGTEILSVRVVLLGDVVVDDAVITIPVIPLPF